MIEYLGFPISELKVGSTIHPLVLNSEIVVKKGRKCKKTKAYHVGVIQRVEVMVAENGDDSKLCVIVFEYAGNVSNLEIQGKEKQIKLLKFTLFFALFFHFFAFQFII